MLYAYKEWLNNALEKLVTLKAYLHSWTDVDFINLDIVWHKALPKYCLIITIAGKFWQLQVNIVKHLCTCMVINYSIVCESKLIEKNKYISNSTK